MKLQVEGMTCQGCVRSVTKVIARQTELDEAQISVSLDQKSAEFADVTPEKTQAVVDALAKAGFPAQLAS
jgi:copper chaperone